MNRPGLVGTGLMAISACMAAAAGPSQGRTLEQAIAAAQSARLSVGIAAAEVDIARAHAAQARARMSPTLDFSSHLDRIQNRDSFSGVSASVDIPSLNTTSTVEVTQVIPRYQASAALTARYDLYTGGGAQALLSHKQLSLQAVELSHQMALQQVAVDVSFAYFKLRRACLQTASTWRQLQHAQSVAASASQRLHEGRIAAIEEKVAALTVAEKLSAWRSQQEHLEQAYASYREAVQGTAPDSQETAERCEFIQSIEVDFEHARQLSDQTLDARQDGLKVEAARELVEVRRAALRPQISAYASSSGIGRSNEGFGNSLSSFSYRQSSIGVQLSWNLFDGGLATQKVSEAEAQMRKQTLDAELAAEDREQRKRRSTSDARLAETRLELLRSRLGLARAKAQMARQQLAAGTIADAAAQDSFERERQARDELDAAQMDAVLTQLAVLFPTRRLPSP